jgi:GT2 family glycosyltransferase
MAFWLVMMKRSLFDELGMLDEIFSPGMGEDGDFCIKTINAGYKLIAVPEDVAGHFDTGIVSNAFPIMHIGNGTFADNHDEKDTIIKRNHVK